MLQEHLSNEIKDFTSKKEKFVNNKDSHNHYEKIILTNKPIGFRPKRYDKYVKNQEVKSVQYSEEPEKNKSFSW